MKKERRTEIRTPLVDSVCSWLMNNDTTIHSDQILDMTNKGIFIKSKTLPDINQVIEIRFKLPGDLGIFVLNGKVVWRRWCSTRKNDLPLGFGVEMQFDSLGSKKIMDSLAIYNRNRQIIMMSKRIIEEFYGQMNPDDKGPVA